jgi:hypothetical protein
MAVMLKPSIRRQMNRTVAEQKDLIAQPQQVEVLSCSVATCVSACCNSAQHPASALA